MTIPADVLYASEQIRQWLGELKERAGLATHNHSHAMLRAVLHELRDHLTVARIAVFADALPALVRGILYVGWRPGDPPSPPPTEPDFTDAVTRRLSPHHIPPDTLVADVFVLLAHHTDPARMADATDQWPEALKHLWRDAGRG